LRRRDFITAIAGSAAAWPLAARAQQSTRKRRISVLSPWMADDPEYQTRNAAFAQGLEQLGWTLGGNVEIDYRLGAVAGNSERIRGYAAELVTLAPDVILAVGAITVGPLQQTSRTVPIVFVEVTDPVGAGFVATMARPGGQRHRVHPL
jgi:putative ABC transport system substrate-binding protein